MEKDLPKFEELDAQVLGISVDSLPSHQAFANSCGLTKLPLVSDFNRSLSKEYGVLLPEGHSQRATFIIDKEGKVRWKQVVPLDQQRDDEEILKELRKIEGKPSGGISLR